MMKKPQPTTSWQGVPILFHEPHVVSGFRPVNQPWSNYFFSLFQWHNELMNTWTHLLALFMVLIRGALWWTEFSLLTDPYMWPMAVGIVTMIVLYMCSTGAHWFQNRSELVHYTCFMIDYAGIGLYGFGSTMLHYWYCLHEDFLGSLSHQLAIPVGAVLAVITCICCSISKTKYKRPYPFVRRVWQMSSVLAIYIWLIFPIWYKIGLYMYDGRWESSFTDHIKQMIWFTMGGFFFGSDIPQRIFPGQFDIVGHSHQLFHICIMMTTSKQMDAIYLELTDGVSLSDLEAPTFIGTWGALAFVIVTNFSVVTYFHLSVRARLKEEATKKMQGGTKKMQGGTKKMQGGTKKMQDDQASLNGGGSICTTRICGPISGSLQDWKIMANGENKDGMVRLDYRMDSQELDSVKHRTS